MINRYFSWLLVLMSTALVSCTGILTHSAQFRDLVDRELVLMDTGTGRNWNFWRVPSLALTRHSQGYRLNLLDRAAMPAQSMFRDPSRVEDLGSAVNATIVIEQVREYGMESGYPIVLGTITLPDGNSYPFEAEWRRDYSYYIKSAH